MAPPSVDPSSAQYLASQGNQSMRPPPQSGPLPSQCVGGPSFSAMASFMDVVVETSAWIVVEETLISYFIKLVGLSMGMLQNDPSALYRWTAPANDPEDPRLTTYNLEHRSCAITVFLSQLLKACVSEKALEISDMILYYPAKEVQEYREQTDGMQSGPVTVAAGTGDGDGDGDYEKRLFFKLYEVDKESIVRKQSLPILKSTTTNSEGKRKASILEMMGKSLVIRLLVYFEVEDFEEHAFPEGVLYGAVPRRSASSTNTS
ncbi:hypothetical protein Tco_1123678 [Tanacetum coccineum]|uniref:Uncharacterized protein n=1 Tax=Tanacetum coccineum TaxID=301880 RepID=A0ABQ5J6Y7_9ASTR